LLVNFGTTHQRSMWKLEDGPSATSTNCTIDRSKGTYSEIQQVHLPNYILDSRVW
jgi:hypothetical protein